MSRYLMCSDCGHRMRRDKDLSGYWDGETYVCDWCSGNGSEYDDNDDDGDESLSVDEAAQIWASHGKDEDYTFGYSQEDLNDAF